MNIRLVRNIRLVWKIRLVWNIRLVRKIRLVGKIRDGQVENDRDWLKLDKGIVGKVRNWLRKTRNWLGNLGTVKKVREWLCMVEVKQESNQNKFLKVV